MEGTVRGPKESDVDYKERTTDPRSKGLGQLPDGSASLADPTFCRIRKGYSPNEIGRLGIFRPPPSFEDPSVVCEGPGPMPNHSDPNGRSGNWHHGSMGLRGRFDDKDGESLLWSPTIRVER